MERMGVMVNIIQGYGYFAVALNTLVLRDMPRAQVLSNTQVLITEHKEKKNTSIKH